MNRRLVLSMLGVLVASATMIGCGLEGQPFDVETTVSDLVVSAEDIAAEKPGSPESTVLQWWRGLQTQDLDAIKLAYAPKLRDDLPEEFGALLSGFGSLAAKSSIEIESVRTKGKRATLRATIDSPNPALNGPLALRMNKAGDDWLIAGVSEGGAVNSGGG